MPYYAVAKGVKPGIYTDWLVCRQYVTHYKGAVFKKFSQLEKAQTFVEENGGVNTTNVEVTEEKKSDTEGAKYKNDGKVNKRSRLGALLGEDIQENSKGLVLRRTIPELKFVLQSKYVSLVSSFCNKKKSSKSPQEISRIFVDGASRGNGKMRLPMSGYGVFYGRSDNRNAAVPLSNVDDVYKRRPTNQRAELFAIKHALIDIANEIACTDSNQDHFDKKYEIHSDSQYAQKCINEWCDTWIKNAWKTSQGNPVLNKDIIASMIPILNYINDSYREKEAGCLQFFHVRGHQGNKCNEAADLLANLGADEMALQH